MEIISSPPEHLRLKASHVKPSAVTHRGVSLWGSDHHAGLLRPNDQQKLVHREQHHCTSCWPPLDGVQGPGSEVLYLVLTAAGRGTGPSFWGSIPCLGRGHLEEQQRAHRWRNGADWMWGYERNVWLMSGLWLHEFDQGLHHISPDTADMFFWGRNASSRGDTKVKLNNRRSKSYHRQAEKHPTEYGLYSYSYFSLALFRKFKFTLESSQTTSKLVWKPFPSGYISAALCSSESTTMEITSLWNTNHCRYHGNGRKTRHYFSFSSKSGESMG